MKNFLAFFGIELLATKPKPKVVKIFRKSEPKSLKSVALRLAFSCKNPANRKFVSWKSNYKVSSFIYPLEKKLIIKW